MPVYKQYRYTKERDCTSCKFYKNLICNHPCPNDFNCCFKLVKIWTKKYYFKTSIRGTSFVHRGFDSKEQARESEVAFRKEILGESYSKPFKHLPTYKTLLIEFGETTKTLKPTYYKQTIRRIENFYSNLFPDIPVTNLLSYHAEKCRKIIDKEEVSCQTKNDKLNFIKRFFLWVNKKYHYSYDPIFLLDKYRDYTIKRQKKKQKIVEFDEFIQIMNKCDDDYYKLAFMTLFIFGYRLSEMLGLTASSVDFNDNTIENYQGINFKSGTGKKGFILTTPKTPSSERIREMPIIYSQMIKKHIETFSLSGDDFIFFRTSGKEILKNIPIHENVFRRKADEYCSLYNPSFHPHMLKTSICTHLREKGISLEEVSKYIGHKDTEVTDRYYSKVSNNKTSLINQAIDELLHDIL